MSATKILWGQITSCLAITLSTPSWHHDAGDVAAEVLLQSGPPWAELDSEPVSIVAIVRTNNSRSQTFRSEAPRTGSLQFGIAAGIGSERARRRWAQSVETEPAADPPCHRARALELCTFTGAVRQTSKPLVCRQCAIRFGRGFVSKC